MLSFHQQTPLIETLPSCLLCGYCFVSWVKNTLSLLGELVRLICIPKFFETGVAVAVSELRNLECHTYSFNIQL
ncbi:hypothetical protein YC2023_008421 [Brassica napus]